MIYRASTVVKLAASQLWQVQVKSFPDCDKRLPTHTLYVNRLILYRMADEIQALENLREGDDALAGESTSHVPWQRIVFDRMMRIMSRHVEAGKTFRDFPAVPTRDAEPQTDPVKKVLAKDFNKPEPTEYDEHGWAKHGEWDSRWDYNNNCWLDEGCDEGWSADWIYGQDDPSTKANSSNAAGVTDSLTGARATGANAPEKAVTTADAMALLRAGPGMATSPTQTPRSATSAANGKAVHNKPVEMFTVNGLSEAHVIGLFDLLPGRNPSFLDILLDTSVMAGEVGKEIEKKSRRPIRCGHGVDCTYDCLPTCEHDGCNKQLKTLVAQNKHGNIVADTCWAGHKQSGWYPPPAPQLTTLFVCCT